MKLGIHILRDGYANAGHRLPFLFLLMFLVGLSDGVSMALLYPVIESVGLATGGPQSMIGSAFKAAFAFFGLETTVVTACVVLVGASLLQGMLFTVQNWVLCDLQKRYVAAWQKKLFSGFISAQWPFFAAQKTGEMLNLIVSEATRLGSALFSILQLMIAALILCIYIVIALFLSWKVTLLILAGGVVTLLVMRPLRDATRRFGEGLSGVGANVSTTLTEMLSGAKFIKAGGDEDKAQLLVSAQVDRLRHNLTWSMFLPTTVRGALEVFGVLMLLAVLVYGLKAEHTGAAQLLVLIALVVRLFPRLMHLQLFLYTLDLSIPAFELLTKIDKQLAEHRENSRGRTIDNVDGLLPADIALRDVVMRYGDKVVLDKVSFTIPARRIVGLVGPSGAGKSTLLDVLMGLIEPSGGCVEIGGNALKDIDLVGWRHRIGYVSQETFLFHDTICNNIRWSVPEASFDAVKAAARAAGMDAYISDLPAGYDTIVGDRGVKLSGGQRQRISIARALIRNPALLILDEATSALDSLSEQEVMGVVNRLTGSMTIVIVAHRLSTVREADLIYVLEHGEIVEQGTWAELSSQQALFQRLMQAQALGGHG